MGRSPHWESSLIQIPLASGPRCAILSRLASSWAVSEFRSFVSGTSSRGTTATMPHIAARHSGDGRLTSDRLEAAQAMHGRDLLKDLRPGTYGDLGSMNEDPGYCTGDNHVISGSNCHALQSQKSSPLPPRFSSFSPPSYTRTHLIAVFILYHLPPSCRPKIPPI